jgi:2'-5' RNA ligase
MTCNYFLAIELPPSLRRKCLSYTLDAAAAAQRATATDNLHITVGYIGPVKTADLPFLQTTFMALEQLPPFVLKFKQLECFGYGKNYRRYLGIEIQDVEGQFQSLHIQALTLLKPWGYTFQGGGLLRPHITLQRLKTKEDPSQAQADFMTQPFDPTVFRVQKLGLWYREPALKRYVSVQDYTLQGG